MFEELMNTGKHIWKDVQDVVHGPVDPAQGSQGRPIGPTSDGSPLGGIGQTVGDLGRGLSSEGLAGLLDPAGMMDRAAAKRELASKFNIIPNDVVGTRAQNQMSQEEFDKIARTYSDIRLGRSDIKLDTAGMSPEDAAKFRGGAMEDIGRMLQTKTGRQSIDRLADNTAGGEKDADGKPVHHTTTLAMAANPNDPGTASEHPEHRFDKTGTNVTIEYAPGHTVDVPGYGKEKFNPFRSDVALAHEMTHAYYNTAGTAPSGSVVGLGDMITNPSTFMHVLAGQDTLAVNPVDVGQNAREYQATGLGVYAPGGGNTGPSENAYRRDRAAIGTGGVGVIAGDKGMVQRDKYNHT